VKALVTGATGFVGSHVVDTLAARGDAVVVLARSAERAAPLARLGARVALGTLDDGAALAAAVAGVNVVYHLAGLTAAVSESAYRRVNVDGTQRLVQATRAASPGPRLVYVSTQAVLGPSPPGQALDEDAPCHPLTAYGRSKLAGEAVVRAAEGLEWTIVRPPAVYGPRDREFLRLFRLIRIGVAPVFGAGAQPLSLVYAPDLAEAIVRAGTAPDAAGQVYHAAHPEAVTSRELALAVGRAVGRTPLIVPVPGALATPIVSLVGKIAAARGRLSTLNGEKMAEFLAPAWLVSSAKAERELGWRAGHDVADGTRLTAAWYREAGWLR
jgi:nucleoside-diphosphate-sugar epimerase